MNKVLEIKNLVKHFPEVKAVDDISFSIDQGKCFGLLGPNGAGKTTTIEIIEGIIPPTSGEILYKGLEKSLDFKQEAGIQFQNTEIPQFLTVIETLEMFRDLYNKQSDLDYLIDLCQLQEIIKRDNRKISGGQKQRLLLAMALANDPELIFLDEPTTGLDPQARRHLWEIVERIKSQNKTIILTTHYMEEAQILCDEIAILDYGKIIAMGPPEDLLKQNYQSTTIIINGNNEDKKLEGISCEYFRMNNKIEIHTEDINHCLNSMLSNGVDLTDMTVRSQNLEDLFLHLTGHKLRT